jgi:uncharacterized protein YlaI
MSSPQSSTGQGQTLQDEIDREHEEAKRIRDEILREYEEAEAKARVSAK